MVNVTARVSRVALVLTLSTETQEGHQPYPLQSGHPGKETTWGGASDDPRCEHTGAATARHAARRADRQCEPGLHGVRHLPDAVLPLAAALRAIRGRRAASAPHAGPSGT